MSYNQAAILEGGTHLGSQRLDQVYHLDLVRNTCSAGSGIQLNQLLHHLSSHRRTFAAFPGSGLITLGGAVAADAHGKNHHAVGSVGNWVREIELWRSDGHFVVKPGDPMFGATVGGLGSTGFIARVDFNLQVLASRSVYKQVQPFSRIEEAIELEEAANGAQFSASWIDLALRPGSGLFIEATELYLVDELETTIPIRKPGFRLPQLPNLAGHALARNLARVYRATTHSGRDELDRFLWPLDQIGNWNRLYGSAGVRQFQCVIPLDRARGVLGAMVKRIVQSNVPAPLAVLKRFGAIEPVGMLSFPMQGITLAVDFPRNYPSCDELVDELEDMTAAAGGRVYLVKSDRLNPRVMSAGYPRLSELLEYRDSAIHSPVIDALERACSAS